MPIQLQSKSTQPNKTVTFDFGSANVLSYVVGISYWSFTYGSKDHHVKTLALSILSNKPTTNTITSTVYGTLSDNGGRIIDSASALVNVSCVALVNSADSQLTLAGAQGIANNGSSPALALPGSSLAIGSSFLSGFNLSYGTTDHHVRHMYASAGFTSSGTTGAITGEVGMSDDDGNSASAPTINGGLIAATPSETGLLVMSQPNVQTGNKIDVDFRVNIAQAVALLQNIDVQYSGDHHIKTIGGGTSGWKISGTKVTLDNARAFMSDNSGNNQADANSNVSIVVVGIPA